MQTFYSNDERNKVVIKNILLVLLVFFSISSFIKKNKQTTIEEEEPVVEKEQYNPEADNHNGSIKPEGTIENITIDDSVSSFVKVEVIDKEGQVIYTPSGKGYRYGPSILRNDDGSVDMWLASPGNNSTEWDWIRYRHSDDGENWSDEQVVLKPTSYSDDQCSTCDPAVIYFNDYYYLGYTSTSDRERNGYNNSVFVARSKNPDGPYEKWNGDGWGGDPEAILLFQGNPNWWGIGEVTFIIKDNQLHLYYTYFDQPQVRLDHAIADLTDDWPKTIRDHHIVINPRVSDAVEMVYVEDLELFLAFAIKDSNGKESTLKILESMDGDNFVEVNYNDYDIEKYAHSLGIEKDKNGHVKSGEEILIGYAYGPDWAEWSTKLQTIKITSTIKNLLQ